MPGNCAAISLRAVRKCFNPGAAPAVDGVTLDVAPGEFLAIIGGSGSGKTTTLKMINRLIEPDSGEIIIEGAPAAAQPAHDLRRNIGYVIQGFGLFPHLTISENIAVTPKLLGWPDKDIAARVQELLALVGLPAEDYAARFPAELSGGQKQRVAIARAIAARPRIVLMDEPFGALDPITRDEVSAAYRALHDDLNLTTIMITHDVQEALLLADQLAVMAQGRILARGAPADLMRDNADPHVRALIDMPRRQARRVRDRLEDARDG
ncbi:MAG: ATP-binding cassette domain-containing protein [Alphaproteobacteria bacterium]|nr:ATP-binding cassette domain-containing protein [Alphaproteobacteria bacterium]